MSANAQVIQAQPLNGIPDSAIDALFGQGLDRDGWRRELERNNYIWVPALKNRIIRREILFFKPEIGLLLSAPNTNPGNKSKSNSRKSILKRLKGKTGERATRLANGTLCGPDAKIRTFEHYVKQWQAEDPTYGVPPTPTVTVDIDEEDDDEIPNGVHAGPADLIGATMTNPDEDAPGEDDPWVQPEPITQDTFSEFNHHHGPPFGLSNTRSAGHLQPHILDNDISDSAHRSNFQQCTSSASMPTPTQSHARSGSQHSQAGAGFQNDYLPDTTNNEYYIPGYEVPEWDSLMSNSMSGYTLGDSNLNEIYETPASSSLQSSRPSEKSSQKWGTSRLASTVQEAPDEIILRAALTEELSQTTQPRDATNSLQRQSTSEMALNPAKIASDSSIGSKTNQALPHINDTEMLDASYSHFSDDDDDDDTNDHLPVPSINQCRQARPPRTTGDKVKAHYLRATGKKPLRKTLRKSDSSWRDMRLRQQIVCLKSESRTWRKELQQKNAELLKKDAEILDLAKRVKLLEIMSKPSSHQYDSLAAVLPSEPSPMDDIIYQDIVHQRRNDKIIQEASKDKAAKKKALAHKTGSEYSHGGNSTDDEKENSSQNGLSSPSRRITRISPSKGAIPLGQAFRFAPARSATATQRPAFPHNPRPGSSHNNQQPAFSQNSQPSGSTQTNRTEKSETPTPAQSPIRRLVRKMSDTLLGRHRESIPPIPILRQWNEVHNDIKKRYTDDSGYASFDLASARSSVAAPGDETDWDEGVSF